jgi:hypothetical protein
MFLKTIENTGLDRAEIATAIVTRLSTRGWLVNFFTK